MSSNDSQNPHGTTANEPLTEVQSSDDVNASVEVSIPRHVQQHPDAPRITGYVLTESLGRGAYGQVWRAWHLRTRAEVAVKIFLQRVGLDWIFLQREVERLLRLDKHPNIVTLLDADLEAETPYYVIKLLEGGSLQQFVDPGATATTEQAVRWAEQIGRALAYVHAKGLIHCDLKPANILLDDEQNIRVVDFGQSRVFTESSASLGTLFYMAPEQAVLTQLGKPVHPDVRWDVYALGATLTAILTGGAPHESAATTEALKQAENLEERLERYRAMVDGSDDNNTTARGKLDADLAAIIDKCLTPTAEGRYPSMAAVLADLEARRKNRPVSPLAHRRGYRLAKFVRRNPLGLSLFAAVVVLFASLASSSLKNREIDRGTAEDAIAAFAQNPTDGLRSSEQSGPRVLAMATDYAGRYVNSPAAPQRVMGARSAPWLNPDAFWRSVDGGMLWHHGEWLELCRANHPWPDAERFVNSLRNMAVNGTPRQKYVAFCLIGERPELCKDLTPQCVDAVKSETEPGVATAAYWAAKQLGHQGDITTGDAIVEDETSGLWFVQLPAEEAFVRGSEPDEVGHEPHENKNQNAPVAISPIYMSTTEATCTAMAPFFQSPAFTNTFKGSVDEKAYDNTAISVETVFGSVPADVSSRAGMGGLRMDVARLYCTWLTERAKDAQPPRRYRLPTEDEWEYACRGGNDGRFCFGDDADYVEYFAACETIANYHTSGTRRPNMYGLFDMHGGLWEWCESRYTARDAAQMSVNLDPNAVLYILRGGGYYSPAKFCRSAQRHYSQPTRLDLYTGMRLVMEAATP